MGRRETLSKPDAKANARRHRLRKLLLLLLLFAMLIALNTTDYWTPLLQHDSGCRSREASVSWPEEFFFKHLMFRRPGVPSSRVAVVTMGDSEASDLSTDVCSGRRFTADVIDALNRHAVSVIALDKEYGVGSCKQEAANAALVAATEHSHVKIVVGQDTHNASEQDDGQCMVLSKGFSFGTAAVTQGITVLNENPLKIPLRWPVFQNDEQAGHGTAAKDTDGETFSLAAAAAADPAITARRAIAANLARHSHPFGDFRGAVDEVTATELLCSDAAGTAKLAEWGDRCAGSKPLDLRGRVVVVASQSSTDVHPFLGGDVPGALLQAHYIEALLSGHYYSEVPFWLAVIVFMVWVAATEALLVLFTSEKNKRAVLAWITVTAVLIVLGLTFFLQLVDVVPPVSFFVAAAVILAFEWISELISTQKSKVFEI